MIPGSKLLIRAPLALSEHVTPHVVVGPALPIRLGAEEDSHQANLPQLIIGKVGYGRDGIHVGSPFGGG